MQPGLRLQGKDVGLYRLGHGHQPIIPAEEPAGERLIEEAWLVRQRIVHNGDHLHALPAQMARNGAQRRGEEGHPVPEHRHLRLGLQHLLGGALPAQRVDAVQHTPGVHLIHGARIELRGAREEQLRVLAGEGEGVNGMLLPQFAHQGGTELRDAPPVGRKGG